MIIYGDEGMIINLIIGDMICIIIKRDSDHVQPDIMYLAFENGVNY
jgi:hypothetical protein